MPDLTSNDRKELSAALEVFGSATVGRTLHKSPSDKQEACREVSRRLEEYREPDDDGSGDSAVIKPAKMMRAASQILARLLRAQVI